MSRVVAVIAALQLLAGPAFAALAHDDCMPDPIGGPPFCTTKPSGGALVAGGIVGVTGPLIGLLMAPRRNDLLDVVNEWNTRHVDQPFTLDRQPAIGH